MGDQELTRYIATINDKDLLKKCNTCMDIIRVAKDRQAAEAAKNANSLLEELDREKNIEESKKAALLLGLFFVWGRIGHWPPSRTPTTLDPWRTDASFTHWEASTRFLAISPAILSTSPM